MPDISELKKSSFVTKSDLGPQGSLFTIINCEQVNVAKDGTPAEMKWALNLQEIDKPFILNATNGQIIGGFTGKTNTDNWGGEKVVLYFDPNVSFGGKLTGGIRARAPRNQPTARPIPGRNLAPSTPPPAPVPLGDAADLEDVPFN